MNWQAYFQSSLDEADHASSLRRRHWHVDESPVCIRRADGRRLVNFATNDYLGLRHDQRLIAAVQQRSLPTTGVARVPVRWSAGTTWRWPNSNNVWRVGKAP